MVKTALLTWRTLDTFCPMPGPILYSSDFALTHSLHQEEAGQDELTYLHFATAPIINLVF